MSLADNIQRIRKEMRYSQAALARATGGLVTAAWVAQVESGGIISPSFDKLKSIATVLGVTVESLYGEAASGGQSTKMEVRSEEELVLRFSLPPGVRLSDVQKQQAEEIMRTVIRELSHGHSEGNKTGS